MHPWGGPPDTDTNTDTDPYGHASWVMGHASADQPYGLRFPKTRLTKFVNTISAICCTSYNGSAVTTCPGPLKGGVFYSSVEFLNF